MYLYTFTQIGNCDFGLGDVTASNVVSQQKTTITAHELHRLGMDRTTVRILGRSKRCKSQCHTGQDNINSRY